MRFKVEDTEEHSKFRAAFIDWLSTVLPPGWVDSLKSEDEAAFKEARSKWDIFSWMKTIGLSGYAAPLWPKEFGGLSGAAWMQQIIREELSNFRLPLAGINLLGVGLAGPTIIEHGNQEQKQTYLQKILTGEEIWCQLFSEPSSGSDLASVGTRAVRDGDEWVVNGQKVWTTIAQFAKYGMLLARTDPNKPKHEGLTYFLLDMKTPGVDVRPLKQMTGSSEFNEVFFTDVRIPDTNRVGDIGDGWRCARTTLMNERVALAGLSIDESTFLGGSAKKDPWQLFLESIPDRSNPIIRQKLAQFWIESQVKEITTFSANSARMRGESPGPEGGVNKVFNAEYNKRRSEFAMNATGMGSIAWQKHDSHSQDKSVRFLRARANTIEGGTSEILRNQMAERILGLPRDIEVDKDLPWDQIPKK
ncbi:MAG: acyl-CoA dehydrogenase [Acidimicrobiales bacterium]|nr:acyl-CoA dehydrogenase [Acidimicrobiales bacterium]